MGSTVFSSSYSTSITEYTTYNVRVSYSESYNASTNKSTISITGVELQKEGNTTNWSDLPFFGSVTVNGTTLLTMNGGASVRVNLSGDGYCSVNIPSSSSKEVLHNDDGTGSFTLGVVGGISFEGDDMFCALYTAGDEYPFGVVAASKTVNLTNRGHTLTTTVSPSGYGTVTGGATLANGKTKSLTATPAATTAQYTYAFSSWSASSGTISSATANPTTFTMGASNATVTANFTRTVRSYTVSCQDRVGSSSGALLGTKTASYTYGSSVSGASFGSSASYDAYYTGYHYIGSSSAITVDGNETVYRYFALNTYTVSYDANGGTGAPPPQTKNQDVDIRLSSVRPTWANELIGNYRVTLDSNGGSVSTSSLSANVYRVRTFSSWNTWRSGGGTTYAPGSTYSINANADMYAQWSVSQKVDSVTLPVPTRTGYSFKGWATSSSASSGITGNYTPPSSITLYAIWAVNQYKLTISQGAGSTVTVVRGGTALTSGSTIYYGDSLTITIAANTGYSLGTHTVNGWAWTSGTHVVSGDVTVVSTANKRTFKLSATLSNSGIVVNMLRTSSPIGGATSGTVGDGTTLYYNDVVSVNCSVSSGFTIKTATVNGSPITFSSGVGRKTVTVTSNVVVVITTEIGAIVYIGNEPYQVFIGDGSNWNQYQAYIGNGSSWEAY